MVLVIEMDCAVRFEVLTAVLLKIKVFWDVTLCDRARIS
jgi:hypothetical protein